MIQSFDDTTLRNLSVIISEMLTHGQITEQLVSSNIAEADSTKNKKDRIFYALKERQRHDNCGNNVLNFVINLLNPKRYNDEATYEKDRKLINEKLSYEGIEIDETGNARTVNKAKNYFRSKRTVVQNQRKNTKY